MLTGGRTAGVPTTGFGRVRRVTSALGRTIITADAPDGPCDLVVGVEPDRSGAAVAAAGLRRLQWVQLDLDAATPTARLAGTTRHPHLRTIPVAAALALAEQGVPTFVLGMAA